MLLNIHFFYVYSKMSIHRENENVNTFAENITKIKSNTFDKEMFKVLISFKIPGVKPIQLSR